MLKCDQEAFAKTMQNVNNYIMDIHENDPVTTFDINRFMAGYAAITRNGNFAIYSSQQRNSNVVSVIINDREYIYSKDYIADGLYDHPTSMGSKLDLLYSVKEKMSVKDLNAFCNALKNGYESTRQQCLVDYRNSTERSDLHILVRMYEQHQRMRIANGLRIVASVKKAMGFKPGVAEPKATKDVGENVGDGAQDSFANDKEAVKIMTQIRNDYLRVTDGIVGNLPKIKVKNFEGSGHIKTPALLYMVNHYYQQVSQEDQLASHIKKLVESEPMWINFFSNVRGCGPIFSAFYITYIDFFIAYSPASIIKYAGYDVAEDGKGRSRKKEHLVSKSYVDADGKVTETNGISYNPKLKSYLYNTMECFLRNNNVRYRTIYNNEKARLKGMPQHADKSDLHIHKMAYRKGIKQFLTDMYYAGKETYGLPAIATYEERILGRIHHARAA